MPHIIIKLATGRSDEQKIQLAEQVAQTVIAAAPCTPEEVSVSIDDVDPDNWVDEVYRPEILGKSDHLYRKPGYGPL